MTDATPPEASGGVARSAGILAFGNVASRILGLLRETIISYYFGSAGELSAFRLAAHSDASTRALKGPQRPLLPAVERAQILAALTSVDLVVIFEELTAESLVAALRPAVYVKGGDWDPAAGTIAPAAGQTAQPRREPPEAAIVSGYGGQVRYLPYLAGHSTRELIALIVARFAPGEAADL